MNTDPREILIRLTLGAALVAVCLALSGHAQSPTSTTLSNEKEILNAIRKVSEKIDRLESEIRDVRIEIRNELNKDPQRVTNFKSWKFVKDFKLNEPGSIDPRDRLPTAEDADENGEVLVYDCEGHVWVPMKWQEVEANSFYDLWKSNRRPNRAVKSNQKSGDSNDDHR